MTTTVDLTSIETTPVLLQARRGAHRDHRGQRLFRVTVSYDAAELHAIHDAASSAGMTPSGYVAAAAVAAATGSRPPAQEPLRELLAELLAARTQLRRFATNVNQAVATLHATGEPPVWLRYATEVTTRAVVRLDDTTTTVARLLSTTARGLAAAKEDTS